MTALGCEGLTVTNHDWFARAACKGQDTDLFFVGPGEAIWEALVFCSRCTVRDECLRYAIDNQIPLGVWGGKSPRQRRNVAQCLADTSVPIPTPERILKLREAGWRVRWIARELGVSESTVAGVLARHRKQRNGL